MSEKHSNYKSFLLNGEIQDLSALEETPYVLWELSAPCSFDVMEYRRIISDRLLFDNIENMSVTVRPDSGIINTLYICNQKYLKGLADAKFIAYLYPLEKADNAKWIENIIDPEMLICDIALPGTHDSAAINTAIHTPYACQDRTIEKQLYGGVRLLDIRIKVVEKDEDTFDFVTCHGPVLSSISLNEYEPLRSVLATCRMFLEKNNREFIVMSLKFDDLTRIDEAKDKSESILDDLEDMLNSEIPNWKKFNNYKVQDVYGKVVVINRLIQDGFDVTRFGEPWEINNSGFTDLTVSNQHIFFQDYYDYKGFSIGSKEEKLCRINEALNVALKYDLVVNYCSFVTWAGITTDYLNTDVRNRLLEQRDRDKYYAKKYGWFFIDYAFRRTDDGDFYSKTYNGMDNSETLVDVIIDLNRCYHFYPLERTDLVYERKHYFDPDILLPI